MLDQQIYEYHCLLNLKTVITNQLKIWKMKEIVIIFDLYVLIMTDIIIALISLFKYQLRMIQIYICINTIISSIILNNFILRHSLFFEFSRQLLQYQVNSNGIPLQLILLTQQKAVEINFTYQLI
ncbi:unnamed protein product [Paramecium sonneborni]|uniref:Transmembrane protein n=1 Tax=Paramecium sonneborni TaxID=65129 RepID=A0A8S1RM42_9CILI|nr:unnamed protein product [Paramecium sonneborni]